MLITDPKLKQRKRRLFLGAAVFYWQKIASNWLGRLLASGWTQGGRSESSVVSGALSMAVGALIPIIPTFFLAGIPTVLVAAAVSLATHFAVVAAKRLITISSWWPAV